MLLPALFTSGMALVDTCDGLLVLFTFAKGNDGDAAGALLFGALLTAASAAASLAIGSIVGLGLVAPFLPPRVAGPLVALSDAHRRAHDGRRPRGRRHVRGCVGAVHGGADAAPSCPADVLLRQGAAAERRGGGPTLRLVVLLNKLTAIRFHRVC